MLKDSKYLVFALLSVLLTLFAPTTYNLFYCSVVHWVFLLEFFLYYKDTKSEGFIRFPVILSICFYFVNFVYPVFLYPNPLLRNFSMFGSGFNKDIINYATGVAFCAYAWLIYGMRRRRNKNKEKESTTLILSNSALTLSLNGMTILFAVVLSIFLLTGGLSFFTAQFSHGQMAGNTEGGYIFAFMQPIAMVVLILCFHSLYQKSLAKTISIFLLFILVASVLLTGSRTFPMAMIMMAVALYNDKVKRIKFGYAVVGIAVFVLLMTLIGFLRGGGENISSIDSGEIREFMTDDESSSFLIQYFSGLIMNNHSLYTLIDYAKNNSYTFGLTLLGPITGTIPYGQTLFSSLFDVNTNYMGSATFNTLITMGFVGEKGMGTNMVSDIYLCFGLPFVIIIFYYFGYIVETINLNKNKSVYYQIAYYVIISDAIYISRSTSFQLIKMVLWAMFFMWLITRIFNIRNLYSSRDV